MLLFLAKLLITLVLLLNPLLSYAEIGKEPLEWLKKMVAASQQLNYEGRLAYVHGGEIEVIHVIHGVDDKGEHERLIHLNGTLREVIRTNDQVICILADDESISVEKGRDSRLSPASLLQGLQQAQNQYHFNLVGQERITDRMATRIDVISRDKYRYGYRIWVDAEHGLLLKSVLLNEQQVPIEQLMFTQLTVLDHFPEAKLSVKLPRSLLEQHQSPKQKVVMPIEKNWQIEWAPMGFKKIEHDRHILVEGGQPVEHIVYSDGLASVSIYVERAIEKNEAAQGDSRLGAMSMHRSLRHNEQVTVLGEVPLETVQMIGSSLAAYQGEP